MLYSYSVKTVFYILFFKILFNVRNISGRMLPAAFALVDRSFSGMFSDPHCRFLETPDGSDFN